LSPQEKKEDGEAEKLGALDVREGERRRGKKNWGKEAREGATFGVLARTPGGGKKGDPKNCA